MTGAVPRAVLVVDDVPEIAAYLKTLLRRLPRAPVEIVCQTDAMAALRLATERAFDLVITDYRMPGCTGVDILHAARARNPAGWRVLITGYNEIPESLDCIRGAGVDAYLQKPFDGTNLSSIVTGILGNDEVIVASLRAHARELERPSDGDGAT